MSQRPHDEIRSLIAPYLVGAVSPDEERTVRAHLVSCDECSVEAGTLSRATDALALTVDPVPLPDGFTERVLARIEKEGPEARPARKRRWTVPALAAASLVLAVAVGILGYLFVDAQGDLDLQRRVSAALLREDGLKLQGDGAVGAVVPADEGSVFVVEGLEDIPEDETYQLWLFEGETPVSAGTFEVDDGRAVLETGRSLEGFSGAAVTVEPEGGSRGPTSDPVLGPV
ncbi:MAG: anti-sigma factor [Actinomycetota bacterium]|nr:anti-sigma factor [Actinomycetota bacterium]